MKMISWTERRSYSLAHDAYVARISGFDERHQEHWKLIEDGKDYRKRRADVVLAIQDHIEAGLPAGELS